MTRTATSPILHLIRRTAQDRRLMDLPDHELLGCFLTGQDKGAFDALLRRHGSMVLNVCRSLLQNEQDAEDAFQATFLVFAQKAGAIRKRSSVGSWLCGVAYRTANKARVRSARRQKHEAACRKRELSPAPDDLTWREVQELLHAELSRLPERYRAALVYCYLEGKTQDEAARLLGVSRATLKKRLEAGRALLRARLVRQGLGPAAVLAASAWPTAKASALVPFVLLDSTVEAAALIAAGQAVEGVISPKVLALAEGVLKAMFLTKLKLVAAVMLTMLVGTGLAGWSYRAAGQADRFAPQATNRDPVTRDERPVLRAPQPRADKEGASNLLRNGGMEEGDQSPAHWLQGAEIPGVEYVWDKEAGFKSKASLCLHKTANRYFPVAQWYQVFDRQGDSPKVRLSAQVKAEKVTKAILDVIFLDEKGEWISHKWAAYIGAQQPNDPPADHDWKEYSGQVNIPESARKIQIGLQIYGPGKVWFDEVRAKYVK